MKVRTSSECSDCGTSYYPAEPRCSCRPQHSAEAPNDTFAAESINTDPVLIPAYRSASAQTEHYKRIATKWLTEMRRTGDREGNRVPCVSLSAADEHLLRRARTWLERLLDEHEPDDRDVEWLADLLADVRRETIEACARICEDAYSWPGHDINRVAASQCCALRIRALLKGSPE